MAGDYTHFQMQNSAGYLDRQIVAADDTTALNNLIVVKSTAHAIVVQKLTFHETTESNGKTLTFQDDASTPVLLGKYFSVTAAAGIPKSFVGDYGPRGYQLTTGKNFDVVVSAAGMAGALHVEYYQKLVGPVGLALGTPGVPPTNTQG